MVNVVKDYDNSYSYRHIEERKQKRNMIIMYHIMEGVLVALPFFIPIIMSNKHGNGLITVICWVVCLGLFLEGRRINK